MDESNDMVVEEHDKLQEDADDMDTMKSELYNTGGKSVKGSSRHAKSNTNDRKSIKQKIIFDLLDDENEQADENENTCTKTVKEPEKKEIAYFDDPLIYYLPQGSKKYIEEVKTLEKDMNQNEELKIKEIEPMADRSEYLWKFLEPESTECIPIDSSASWKVLPEEATLCIICNKNIGNTIKKHKIHKKATEHNKMSSKWEEKHGLIKHFFKKRNEIVSSMLSTYKEDTDEKAIAFWQKISNIYFKMPINMHQCCGMLFNDAKEFMIHKSTLKHLCSEDFAKLKYNEQLQEIFYDPFLEIEKELASGSHAKRILHATKDHFDREKLMVSHLLSSTPSAQLMPDKKSIAPYDPAVAQGLAYAKFRTVFECRICDLYYGTAKYFLEHCKSLDHYENMVVYKRKGKEKFEKERIQKEESQKRAARLRAHQRMVEEKREMGVSFYDEENGEVIDYGSDKTWCRRIGLYDALKKYCVPIKYDFGGFKPEIKLSDAEEKACNNAEEKACVNAEEKACVNADEKACVNAEEKACVNAEEKTCVNAEEKTCNNAEITANGVEITTPDAETKDCSDAENVAMIVDE